MKKFLLAASALLLALQSAAAPAQIYHDNKTVSGVLEDDRPCVFFTLTGVNDSGGNPEWFAIQRTHAGFSELFAMLLTARTLQLPVRVHTTGSAVADCGNFVGVKQIWIKN